MEFVREFLRKASHSTKIYQMTRKRPAQGGTAWFTCPSNKQWKCLYLIPRWWHWYSSNSHQIDHANFQSMALILEMVANEREYSLIQYSRMRINTKLLVGFHAYSGNDYLPALFWKGKQLRWKKMLEKENFLSNSWNISDNLRAEIEKFVCHLYSSHESGDDDSRL